MLLEASFRTLLGYEVYFSLLIGDLSLVVVDQAYNSMLMTQQWCCAASSQCVALQTQHCMACMYVFEVLAVISG